MVAEPCLHFSCEGYEIFHFLPLFHSESISTISLLGLAMCDVLKGEVKRLCPILFSFIVKVLTQVIFFRIYATREGIFKTINN